VLTASIAQAFWLFGIPSISQLAVARGLSTIQKTTDAPFRPNVGLPEPQKLGLDGVFGLQQFVV